VRTCRLLRFIANRHASKHFLATDHPLARSIEPGEPWIWCYRDNIVASEIET
jgi:hypothetical protein